MGFGVFTLKGLPFVCFLEFKSRNLTRGQTWSIISIVPWETFSKLFWLSITESAGSASVAFHLLSPGSRGYFSQAILQSAAATNPWAMVTKKEAKLRARRLAEVLDCPHDDVSKNSTLFFIHPPKKNCSRITQ